jgi:hypothetical protein
MAKQGITVFVSYASSDARHKDALLRALQREGPEPAARVLTDDGLHAGEWSRQLDDYIRQADIGVLLLSDEFIDSGPCRKEMLALLERGSTITVVPVIVTKCAWRGALPQLDAFEMPLRRVPLAEYQGGTEEAWQRVAEFIALAATLVPEEGEDSPLVEALTDRNAVEVAVRRGAFSPILGPSSHGIRENQEPAFPDLRLRLQWLLGGLDTSLEVSYVNSIVESKIPSVITPGLRALRYLDGGWRKGLIDLQVGLVRAGVEAARLFGCAMSVGARGITDLETFAVDIEQPGCDRSSLRALLMDVTKLAAALEASPAFSPEPRDLGLGASGIRQQLVRLTWAIFFLDLLRDAGAGEWRAGFPIEEGVHVVPADKPRLSLSQLEWLGDLVWHTLRFDVPMYPSPDDLSFQLAVCALDIPPPRRQPVGAVALLAREEDRAELIGTWLAGYSGRSQDGPVQARGFYGALCRALTVARSDRTAPRIDGGPLSSAKRVELAATVNPLAINTNFDIELERELRRRGCGFCVLLPIYVEYTRSGKRRRRADWVLITEGTAEKRAPLLLGESDRKPLLSALREIAAPVIVKLNGSPLHRLPEDLGELRTEHASYLRDAKPSRLLHRIVLSDYDFLRELVGGGDDSLPAGLRDLLGQEGRTLCFLGYPVTDSNSRLRLYEHIRGEQRPSEVMLVESPADALQQAFLNSVRVRFVKLGIDEVAKVIHTACDRMSNGRRSEEAGNAPIVKKA